MFSSTNNKLIKAPLDLHLSSLLDHRIKIFISYHFKPSLTSGHLTTHLAIIIFVNHFLNFFVVFSKMQQINKSIKLTSDDCIDSQSREPHLITMMIKNNNTHGYKYAIYVSDLFPHTLTYPESYNSTFRKLLINLLLRVKKLIIVNHKPIKMSSERI